MARFAASARVSPATKTTNYMDGVAFTQPAKEELAFSVLAGFLNEDSYYEAKSERLARVQALVVEVAKRDPAFVAKLAVYSRNVFQMRTAFPVLIGNLARVHHGNSLVRHAIVAGASRVDDLTELIAFTQKPIPNAMKKGIAEALRKFDAYQLAKYRNENRAVKLVDVFNLVHPKPGQGQEESYGLLMKGKLTQTGETWEARLSSGEDKRLVWAEMVPKKLGYMALLRNLRNIARDADEATITLAAARIANPDEVQRSRQLPFRFLSAHNALKEKSEGESGGLVFEKQGARMDILRSALEKAVSHAVANIPMLPGRTVILTDNSGSMRGDGGGDSPVSALIKRTTADIANLFAVLYWTRAENTYVGLFGDKLIEPPLDRSKGVFANFATINNKATECGQSTEEGVFIAFEQLLAHKQKVDRIVIFSDMQVGEKCEWYDTGHSDRKAQRHGNDFNKLFQEYIAFSPETVVYSVDLKGYGTRLMSHNVFLLAGWSEKIFDLMQMTEKGMSPLLHEINAVTL